jgi:hypothetical protein
MKARHLFAAGAIAFAGCASTSLTSKWSDPALGATKFDRIAVLFQHPDAAFRRSLEDAMVASIPNATPAYRVIDDADVRDEKRAADRLKAARFDALVVMRVVSLDKETTYVPGTMHGGAMPYGRMRGGYSYGWSQVYEPGYLRTDKILVVGTNVYALDGEKLVWASRSETFNPGDLPKVVKDVVAANAKAVRAEIGR